MLIQEISWYEVMTTLPPSDMAKMQEVFEDLDIHSFNNPMETNKFNEKALISYSRFINIVYQCTSKYNGALLTKEFKSALWSTFLTIFGMQFDIPATCSKDFINCSDT